MNIQQKFDKEGRLLSRGIEWTAAAFGDGTGFTVNCIRGCEHGCRWRMPDGKIVDCYAESTRDRMDGPGAFKNITFHPEVFASIRARKKPAGIFADSMSDMLGNGVNAEWVEQFLAVVRECPQHVFFVLTKNPRRLGEFAWPDNVMLGISAPPSFMFGKELNVAQQRTWFRKGFEWLMACDAKYKWVSFEPLAIDVTDVLNEYKDFDGGAYTALDWAVIGAGSDGRKTYQPDELIFQKTQDAIAGCPVWYKGNLDRALAERYGGWREEFTKMAPANLL